MAFNGPFDILGFFLGYMSGPLVAENREEGEERYTHVVILPEGACPTRRAV